MSRRIEELPESWREEYLRREHASVQENVWFGVRLYEGGHPWYAHEVWEDLWKSAEGTERLILQGLIQLAAARHHASAGNEYGVKTLLTRSKRHLDAAPRSYRGCDLARVHEFLARFCANRESIPTSSEFPAIDLC